MRKSEAVKRPLASPCQEVQGDVEHVGFEFVSDLFGGKVASSSTGEISQNNIGNCDSLQSELEEGELTEGIEANDVGALLEQFLEYEEKQGSLDCSSSSVSLHSSLKDTTLEAETIAHKISSFVDAQDIDFDFPLNVQNGVPSCLDVEISGNSLTAVNGENQDIHVKMGSGPFQNGVDGHDESDKKCHVDNHATDHNYACSGFPMRKAIPLQLEVNDHSTINGTRSNPKKSLASDLEHKNEKKCSNGTEMTHSRKRRSSCDSADRKRKLPKRYRGPYCEDSSNGDSSSDEDHHSNRSRNGHHNNADEPTDHKRTQRKRKYSYCSDENKNYRKRSNRRHSLYSTDSSEERDYTSSDEDSKNERRCRYDPRCSESDLRRKQSSGSDRDSDSYKSRHRRQDTRHRRSRSKDRIEKRDDDKKDKTLHDIELERKLEFKFDHHIKNTAKEERRIVYIGKISNKTTEDDVRRRFRPFGPIEKVTVHFRDKGDNYAFVTFFDYSSAAEAIEKGNEDSHLPVLDICFGGRRKFCGGSYVDFDSNTSYLEEQEFSRPPSSDEMDFDALLRLSQKGLKGRKESCKGR